MADSKITALTALTVPTTDDLVLMVDDPAGTPVAKKCTVLNLFNAAIPAGMNGALFKALTADATAASASGVQPWFPSAGAVTLAGSTSYQFEGLLALTNGTTTHTTALAFGGTATLTSLMYHYLVTSVVAGGAAGSTTQNSGWNTSASSTVINATSTTAGLVVLVRGIIRVNAGGTLIPQFNWSANPTGTNLVKANTFFVLYPIGTNTVVSQGTWA
jgi:hypothetical protein